MRKKSDKLPKYKRLGILAVILVFLTILAFLFTETRLRKYSAEMGEYYCRSQLSVLLNEAVIEVLKEKEVDYSHLTADIYDSSGRFTGSKLSAEKVNILQSFLCQKVNEKLGELSEKNIGISGGTLSGIYLLNGRGPKIKIRLIPVGGASAKLSSAFESAGINQICHSISVDISIKVKIHYPSSSDTITVSGNYIIARNIIAGEVPKGYICRYQ